MAGSLPRLPQRLIVKVETRKRLATSPTVRRSGRLFKSKLYFFRGESLLSIYDIEINREGIFSQAGRMKFDTKKSAVSGLFCISKQKIYLSSYPAVAGSRTNLILLELDLRTGFFKFFLGDFGIFFLGVFQESCGSLFNEIFSFD